MAPLSRFMPRLAWLGRASMPLDSCERPRAFAARRRPSCCPLQKRRLRLSLTRLCPRAPRADDAAPADRGRGNRLALRWTPTWLRKTAPALVPPGLVTRKTLHLRRPDLRPSSPGLEHRFFCSLQLVSRSRPNSMTFGPTMPSVAKAIAELSSPSRRAGGIRQSGTLPLPHSYSPRACCGRGCAAVGLRGFATQEHTRARMCTCGAGENACRRR